MIYSVTDIECSKCSFEFKGALKGSFSAEFKYLSQCPKCNEKVSINFRAAFIGNTIPVGAASIETNNN